MALVRLALCLSAPLLSLAGYACLSPRQAAPPHVALSPTHAEDKGRQTGERPQVWGGNAQGRRRLERNFCAGNWADGRASRQASNPRPSRRQSQIDGSRGSAVASQRRPLRRVPGPKIRSFVFWGDVARKTQLLQRIRIYLEGFRSIGGPPCLTDPT